MRLPTFRQLRRYVEVEGWEDRDSAAGRATGDHHRYVFTTPTGERLYTRISHGRGQVGDADLFAHILRDQLRVTVEQFWAAVDRGEAPARPRPEAGGLPDERALDAKLVRALVRRAGVSPIELSMMTQSGALARWAAWLESPSTEARDPHWD